MKLKKWVLGLITFAAMVVLCAVCAGAETYEDFEYSALDDGTVEITSYSGSAEKVDIPEKIDGKSVTSIGDWAFNYCESLKSVTIPDSVTSIGDSAFNCCTSLKSITIPGGVTSIGDKAFRECSSLISISIQDGVTSIGESTFEDCINLKSITIPDSVTSIGEWAFNRCANITSVTIPNSVTSIGNNAFIGCESLTEIKVAAKNVNYASVNGVLFNKDKSKLVFYPGGKIDKNYSIPESVTDIGRCAFDHCISLTSVTIPNSVTSIGDGAFEGCTSLKSIVISDSVTSIGGSAFGGCISLKSIIIPKGVTIIEYEAFGGCLNLRSIDVVEDNSIFASENGVLFNKNKTRLIYYPSGKTDESYEIPNGVVTIDGQAFFCCSNLVSIKLPHSVTEISEYAFFGCTKLKSIIIPSSVTTIWRYAFGYCSGDWWLDKIANFKIYCYSGTAGEQYAKDNGFAYELLADKPTLAKVTGVKLGGRAADALRVNWNKDVNASGYIVEMYQGNKWVRVAKITNNSTTTFRKAGLKAGTVYKFRVKAYKMYDITAAYSEYSATVTARTNPSVIKGAKLGGRAADALRINWTKNTSADGYIVEMYQGNKWVRVAKITNNSTTTFRKAGLKASTVYKFRVRAYKMSGKTALYGNYSATVTARTNPSIVKGVKIGGKAKDALRVNWTKNASAQGYIVEMYKGGKWVRVAKITNGNTTTFRKAGLAKNTTYKFRVKAYYMSGKTALYGNYGSVSGKTAAK